MQAAVVVEAAQADQQRIYGRGRKPPTKYPNKHVKEPAMHMDGPNGSGVSFVALEVKIATALQTKANPEATGIIWNKSVCTPNHAPSAAINLASPPPSPVLLRKAS